MKVDDYARNIRGKSYRATVLKVITSDGEGPRTFELVRPEEVVTIEDGDQFWVVYAPEEVLRRLS